MFNVLLMLGVTVSSPSLTTIEGKSIAAMRALTERKPDKLDAMLAPAAREAVNAHALMKRWMAIGDRFGAARSMRVNLIRNLESTFFVSFADAEYRVVVELDSALRVLRLEWMPAPWLVGQRAQEFLDAIQRKDAVAASTYFSQSMREDMSPTDLLAFWKRITGEGLIAMSAPIVRPAEKAAFAEVELRMRKGDRVLAIVLDEFGDISELTLSSAKLSYQFP